MTLYIGNQKIGSLYLGSTKIKEAWVGDVKVFGSGSYHFDEVQIGNQIWTSKNLAIDDGLGGIYTKSIDYGQGLVLEYYYTLEAALRVASSIDGWHLPIRSEWDQLTLYVSNSTKLKSTYGWEDDGNGTDDYGFTALPAGYYYDDTLYDVGRGARFWISDNIESQYRYSVRLNTSKAFVFVRSSGGTLACSVRLIKD